MIRLYRVSKEYNGIGALIDVSVHVTKGEFCYISGPSGAGKSTLLKMLYGAIKPTRGKLLINNIDMGPARVRDIAHLRRHMGVVFQDFKLIPRRTVAENVGLALEVLGTPREVIARRVAAVLSIVGLRGRGDELPLSLSGGEQQRVAVARAIVNDPAVILADEPTGNLDGAMAIEVMEVLQAVNLRGTTVLVATHDAGLMQRFPYRTLRFRAGRLEAS
jgi:cell division transport system ATP-binding protein